MKISELKKAYTKPPQSFHFAVVRSLNRLDEVKPVRSKSKIMRVAIVCGLIVSLIIVGTVSVAAIYPMIAEKNQNYGLNIHVDGPSEDTPEFVKINIGWLPDGVAEYQGKYSLNGEGNEKCITITHSRVVEKQPFSELNVVDYTELEINSHQAIIANVAVEPFSKRFYVYFEKEALFVEAYATGDVTDEEIKTVIENITVEECTEEESNTTSLTEAKKMLKESKWMEAQEKLAEFVDSFKNDPVIQYSDITLGQSIAFENSESMTENTLTIDNIEILDNVSDLDRLYFYDSDDRLSEYVDENGSFLPYTRNYYKYGDGLDTPFSEVTKTDTARKNLVYATLSITNTTDEANTFSLQGFSIKYDVDSSSDLPDHAIALYESAMSEIDFVMIANDHTKDSNYAEGNYHDFYFVDIAPNTTETVYIGFLADEDMIDKAYLELDANWCNGLTFDSAESAFVYADSGNYYNIAKIKVQ